MVELVDLASRIEEGQPHAGSADDTRIFTTQTHEDRAYMVSRQLEEEGLDPDAEYVRRHGRAEREGYDEEQPYNRTLLMSEHGPTHVDAIHHMDPMSEYTIDEMPLDWFYGDAVGVDVSHIEHPDPITANELRSSLDEHDLELREGDAITIETGNWANNYSITDREKKYRYEKEFVGLEGEAAEWLVEQGVETIGIDSLSVDHPANIFPGWNFPVHSLAAEHELVIVENMANLASVAGQRYTLCTMPLKINDGTGSPVRPFAILE
jgi:kynurenine formamidase